MAKEWCYRIEFDGFVYDGKDRFNNAMECVEFIDRNETLIIINYLFRRIDYQIGNLKGELRFCERQFIKPYNVVQKRYSDGFDY